MQKPPRLFRKWFTRLLPAFVIVASVIWWASPSANAVADSEEFSVDIDIKFRDAANPSTSDWMPPMALRFERSRTTQGLRDRLVVRQPSGSAPLAAVQREVAALEVGPDGQPHAFNNTGQEIPWPTMERVQELIGGDLTGGSLMAATPELRGLRELAGQFGNNGWSRRRATRASGFFGPIAGADARRNRLRNAWGAAQGQRQGLDRYVRATGTTVREVLVDPTLQVPLELNTTENGQLKRHLRRSYQLDASGRILLYGVHMEQAELKPGGHRLAIDATYSGYRIGRR